MIPCDQNPAFIDDSIKARRMVAEQCFDCPVFDLCEELGRGEEFGVYAGTLENDPARTEFRKENRAAYSSGARCQNGHALLVEVPIDDTGAVLVMETSDRVDLDSVLLPDSNLPRGGCRRCKRLRDAIDDERRAHRPDHADLLG